MKEITAKKITIVLVLLLVIAWAYVAFNYSNYQDSQALQVTTQGV